MGKDNEKKKKKNKTVYVDDGSTISDMSGLRGSSKGHNNGLRPRASFKEQFKTYTDAVKMMFFPMLVVLGIIALAFLIVYILL